MRTATILTALLLLGAASEALGAEILVPGDEKSIQKAVDQSKAGDTVRVAQGIYTEFIQLKTGVALVGAGAEKTVLKPPQGGCVLSLSGARDVWVDGFTLTAGERTRALDASASSFTLSNCVVEGNGEGIGITECYLTVIRNNRFRNNETDIKVVGAFPSILFNLFAHTPTAVFLDDARANLSHNCVFDVKRPYIHIGEDSGDEEAFEPSPGVGSLASDPLFEDAEKADFRLKEGSPCKVTGIRKPFEPGDTKADMGLFPDGKAVVVGLLVDKAAREACKPSKDEMIVNHVNEEYLFLRKTPCACGGTFRAGRQALMRQNGRSYDKLTPTCSKCGKPGNFKFDVSRFFGESFLVMKKKGK